MNVNVKWDAVGIGASLACAIHCVLLPIAFSTLPLFGIEVLENIYLEIATILVSVSAGGWAILRGYRKRRGGTGLVALFLAGLTLMITGNFLSSEPGEIACKACGALLIITAHVKNWKTNRTHCHV